MKNLVCFVLHITNADSFPPPLSAAQEVEMIRRMQQGDIEAKNELISHNLRLVAHIIKKYYATAADQEDLISIGTIGLIKGINSFKPEKGTKLATYAARCIENEILMYFRSCRKNSQEVSFSEPIDTDSEGNPLTLMDIISVDDTIVEDMDLSMELRQLVYFVREIENQRDKEIIVQRYGLNGKRPLTQREVAERLHISRSYVSRIEKRVLAEIRRKFKETGHSKEGEKMS